ncbi:unnamed protein product [Ambrosiozyma monospora]|uniref:Unnamed protein product n=1 Tax=Ambrosiozyma monospora TaxID=43982 RepID=A0ACB5SR96_AMBMO|nr:unnamed protein product [Ambrosiozyma monospora]
MSAIKLYTNALSPNGQKVSLLLDLLKVKYISQSIDILKGEQKQPWYLKINPNGKVPALEDVDANGNKKVVFESAAILHYLANSYDTKRQFSYGLDDPLYYQELEWTLFSISGFEGARTTQFLQYFLVPEKDQKVLDAASTQVETAFSVFETQLKKNGNGFLVGDHISIADIDAYPWVSCAGLPFDGEKFPVLKGWVEKIGAYKSS